MTVPVINVIILHFVVGCDVGPGVEEMSRDQ